MFLYKRYRHRDKGKCITVLHTTYVLIILLLLALAIVVPVLSQKTNLTYNIKRGATVIGLFKVYITNVANSNTIKLVSDIKTGFIITITVNAREECFFENGVLKYSQVYRKINGSEIMNKKLYAYGGGYRIISKGKADSLCCTLIQYNLMCMYNKEPSGISSVYSDNYQQFISITNTAAHQYRINLPDRSYQIYYYKKGVCTKVDVHHTLYKFSMEII